MALIECGQQRISLLVVSDLMQLDFRRQHFLRLLELLVCDLNLLLGGRHCRGQRTRVRLRR